MNIEEVADMYRQWHFPLLSAIKNALANRPRFLNGMRSVMTGGSQGTPVVQNAETITFTDWAGRKRVIEVNREIR